MCPHRIRAHIIYGSYSGFQGLVYGSYPDLPGLIAQAVQNPAAPQGSTRPFSLTGRPISSDSVCPPWAEVTAVSSI